MNELAKVIWYYDLGSISEKKICCPLHGDINPSLSLFYEENKWFALDVIKAEMLKSLLLY